MSSGESMDLTRRQALQGGAVGAAALSISALRADTEVAEAAVVEGGEAAQGRRANQAKVGLSNLSLSERIQHTDPKAWTKFENLHGGAGHIEAQFFYLWPKKGKGFQRRWRRWLEALA